MNIKIHQHISNYIDDLRREYITADYMYASYTAPNTMYATSNQLDYIMLTLSHPAIKVWFRCMTMIRRNTDPVLACSLMLKPEFFSDLMGRNSYFKGLAELVKHELLIKTPKRSLYIVNVSYANKLYKPKLVEVEEVLQKAPPPPPK